MTTLRILSYNMHKGFAVGGRNFVLDGIREALSSVEADIVFLQEVIGEHERHAARVDDWPEVSQFEYLADTRWPHYAYAQNAVYDAGHHGNAILSRYPIVSWNNIDLSTNPLERRGMMHAHVQIPEACAHVHCCCVHMSLFERSRRKQLDSIVSHLTEVAPPTEPLVLAGDFNDWRRSADQRLAQVSLRDAVREGRGKRALTFPSWLPILPLDRIYVRGLRVERSAVLRGQVWSKLSDHAAVYVELSFRTVREPSVNM